MYYTTQGGYRRLRERLEKAREAYFKVCASNEEAAGAGDSSVWHDNFAYEENQRQMQALAHRVHELEVILSQLQLVTVHATPPEAVSIGTRVRIRFVDDDREQTLFIGGYDDGEPAASRISYQSPLAQALMGKEEGDLFSARIGPRVRRIEVLDLLPPPPEEVSS